MKKIILSFIAFFVCVFSFSQTQSFAEKFFQDKIGSKSIGKIFCPTSGLDSILMKNEYHISRIYDSIPFYSNGEKAIIFFLTTNKDLIGLKEYAKANSYKNNILVVFKKKADGTFFMTDYFYKPINQGMNSFSTIEIEVKNGMLYLQQFGDEPDSSWGTEYVFVRKDTKWMLKEYSLYDEDSNFDGYKMIKKIWTKKSDEKKILKDIFFSDFFSSENFEF